jgi:hypothetical protein
VAAVAVVLLGSELQKLQQNVQLNKVESRKDTIFDIFSQILTAGF